MTTPAVTPQSPFAEFGGASTDAPTAQPLSGPSGKTPNPFAEFGGVSTTEPPTAQTAPVTPYNPKTHGEFTTPENYTAWSNQPTDSNDPNVANKDWKFGERAAVEEAHGSLGADTKSAINVNHAATGLGVGLGGSITAIPEVLPSILIHTVEGAKALGVWAEAHPYKAFMLYQVAKELLPGAKKAMGLVKAVPEVTP